MKRNKHDHTDTHEYEFRKIKKDKTHVKKSQKEEDEERRTTRIIRTNMKRSKQEEAEQVEDKK